MKTKRQWLEGIKDKKVRKQALKNTSRKVLNNEYVDRSLNSALAGAFVWANTPEGHDYWHRATKTKN